VPDAVTVQLIVLQF